MGPLQTALCFVSFSLISLLYLFIKKRKFPVFLLGIFIVSTIFLFISFRAPGNAVRLDAEISYWFPSYHELILSNRIKLTLIFLLSTMINQWYLPLTFLWLITAILLLKKPTSKISKIIAYLSLLFAIIMMMRFIIPTDSHISSVYLQNFKELFHFKFLNGENAFQIKNSFPYFFWGISIVLIPISISLIFKNSPITFLYITIFLASLGSLILIALSPTVYASGGRTSFVSNMLLIILILQLLKYNGVFEKLFIPILLVAIFKLSLYFSNWFLLGYELNYGVLDQKEIPFVVLGPR